ncbi:MAG TPA: flagellar basal-body rod protein FlgF [bacterium]|jgi:flagellar basal-body rod protein FlgF|nr:flagellar basal-body rod protein FlgF [bacterium]
MPNGLYIAASGMNATLSQQDVIANNLANVSTVGFKQNRSVDVAFPTYLIARLHDQQVKTMDGTAELRPAIGLAGGGVATQNITTDFAQGAHLQTQNPLDLAISGSNFFTVMAPNGKTFLTRDGSFDLDANGRLATKDGLPVMGHNGEIFIDGSQVVVDKEGNITVDSKPLDQLLIVKAQDQTQLTKVGHNLFEAGPQAKVDKAPDDINVQQGFLEQSNVNSMREMVNMIDTYRSYELNSRIISTYDHVMSEASSEIGSLKV